MKADREESFIYCSFIRSFLVSRKRFFTTSEAVTCLLDCNSEGVQTTQQSAAPVWSLASGT